MLCPTQVGAEVIGKLTSMTETESGTAMEFMVNMKVELSLLNQATNVAMLQIRPMQSDSSVTPVAATMLPRQFSPIQQLLLNERNPALMTLIDAIPQNIEHLDLQFWDPCYGGRTFPYFYSADYSVSNFHGDDLRDALDGTAHSPLPNLKRLSFSYFAVYAN